MVSGNKKSKSKVTATTPTKTIDQTTAQRQLRPNDNNLEILQPATSPELRQMNLKEQVKKQVKKQ